MVSAKTKVINPQGLHMRPAQVFVAEIEIQCSGPQEAEALEAAVKLVESGLGDL